MRIGIALLLWIAAQAGGFAQTQMMTLYKCVADDGHGNCTTFNGSDNACGNLAVTVAPDAVPGDYTYDLLCNPDIIGDGGNVVRSCCGYGHQTTVHVMATLDPNQPRTYCLDPDSGLACMGNAANKGLSHLYLSADAPNGSTHSEGDVQVNVPSDPVCRNAITVYADIPVTIGPPVLKSVVSRKVHGTSGTFDVDLPISQPRAMACGSPAPPSAPRGVECRSGGANGNHTFVFTFSADISAVDAVTVLPCGQVSSASLGPNSNQYTVNLTNVCNGQYITVTLAGVHSSAPTGGIRPTVSATMGVLFGDTTADGQVNASDLTQTQSQSGQVLSPSNFREDVTVNGLINSSDIAAVQSQSGNALPTPP